MVDLRNPTKSDGSNLLHLVNKYMDLWKAEPERIAYKVKAEKYAKIIAKTIISSGVENANDGQNACFYDAAEGLLTSTILLSAEFCPPETRHIVSVFKILQDLLAPSKVKFVVMKTGTHPMQSRLRFSSNGRSSFPMNYTKSKIAEAYPQKNEENPPPTSDTPEVDRRGMQLQKPKQRGEVHERIRYVCR